MAGLEGYVSPYLRKAVFDRMYPGSIVEYDVIPMAEAFPETHQRYPGKAEMAIRCTVIKPDGTYVVGYKEIDLADEKSGRAIAQTPENFAKDQTKALGRALRDAGIPQKVDELQSLMRWHVALEGRTPVSAKGLSIDHESGEIKGSANPDDVDAPDAGADEPTLEQRVAARISSLPDSDKPKVYGWAAERGIKNMMRAGERSEELSAYLDTLDSPTSGE